VLQTNRAPCGSQQWDGQPRSPAADFTRIGGCWSPNLVHLRIAADAAQQKALLHQPTATGTFVRSGKQTTHSASSPGLKARRERHVTYVTRGRSRPVNHNSHVLASCHLALQYKLSRLSHKLRFNGLASMTYLGA